MFAERANWIRSSCLLQGPSPPDAPRCGDGARAERFAWCNVRLTMPGRGAGHGFRAAAVRLADRAARTAGRVDGPLGFTVMVAGSLLTRGRVPADVGATMVAAARPGSRVKETLRNACSAS